MNYWTPTGRIYRNFLVNVCSHHIKRRWPRTQISALPHLVAGVTSTDFRYRYDVITFGDMCVDLIVTGDDIVPEFGQVEKRVDDYALEMGGSCNIFACQAAKLGLKVAVLGRVGDDDFGRLVTRRLTQCGVDTGHVIVDPTLKTGLGIALCQGDDRAILTVPGSLSALKPDDVSDDLLASARHLHHGSFFLHTGLMEAVPNIFERARALGLSTSLDTNWDPDESWNTTLAQVLPLTDLFFPNAEEARRISGFDSVDEAVGWFRDLGIPIVALKLGAGGARVHSKRKAWQFGVIPASGGDSVGAGDSFDAGFIAGWLRDLPIELCSRIACECGRAVAGATGGLAGQPSWDVIASRLNVD